MIDPTHLPPPPGSPVQITYEPRPSRGRCWGALVAWVVIGFIAVAIPLFHAAQPSGGDRPAGPDAAPARVDAQTTIMGKYIVAAARFSPETKTELIERFEVDFLSSKQVAKAALVGEMEGRAAAMSALPISGGPRGASAFFDLYATGRPLPDDVRRQYGFFSRLAEVQGKPDIDPARAKVLREAYTTFAAMAGGSVALLAALAVGAGLFITAIVLAALGKLRFATAAPFGAANVYVEAFALYLGGFVVLSVAISVIAPEAPLWLRTLPLGAAVVFATLWPRLRGVPWAQQRQDWGIHRGRSVMLEVLAGVGGYLAGLPVVAAGLTITYFLMTSTSTTASHPIVEMIGDNPVPLFLLASVFAPITEELMFRGALLSHLRGRLGPIVSGLIVGLIFAAVHPQGWAAIPALGAIGFVLSLVRQWRGSLIAPIAAHALNNSVVLLMVILMAR